jgi:phosphoribosylglycinamide formyltransferase-1
LQRTLLTEDTLHSAYLVAQWYEAFPETAAAHGVALRADPLPASVRVARDDFHDRHGGQRDLDAQAWAELGEIYPGINESDHAMVTLFGLPERPAAGYPGTVFVGRGVNDTAAWAWLDALCAGPDEPYVFVFLDRILAPKWLSRTGNRVVNAHSAVLPHARGMYAIEQVAARQDVDHFRDAAGATVHQVDTGIDTGPIVNRRHLVDPFGYASIWECKAHSFMLAFRLLVEAARGATAQLEGPLPVIAAEPSPHGSPEFRRAAFTPERRAAAERGYLDMKHRSNGQRTEHRMDGYETFAVVYNDEGQYSILPQDFGLPAGWTQDGFVGSQQECLEHIDKVWVDMRPRSARDVAS